MSFVVYFFLDLKSNDTLSRLAWEAEGISNTQPFRLENFTYDNDIIMNTMFGNLQQSDFTGITVSDTLSHTHTFLIRPVPAHICRASI